MFLDNEYIEKLIEVTKKDQVSWESYDEGGFEFDSLPRHAGYSTEFNGLKIEFYDAGRNKLFIDGHEAENMPRKKLRELRKEIYLNYGRRKERKQKKAEEDIKRKLSL